MHLLSNSVSLPYSVTPSAHHVANCACLAIPNCTFFYWRVRSCFVVFGFLVHHSFVCFYSLLRTRYFVNYRSVVYLALWQCFFLTSVGLYISCLVVVTSVWSLSVFCAFIYLVCLWRHHAKLWQLLTTCNRTCHQLGDVCHDNMQNPTIILI